MSPATLGILGLIVLIVGAIAMIAFSMAVMTGARREAAEVNRQNNKPISNGYAGLAVVAVTIVFALVLILGLLPPLLRRG